MRGTGCRPTRQAASGVRGGAALAPTHRPTVREAARVEAPPPPSSAFGVSPPTRAAAPSALTYRQGVREVARVEALPPPSNALGVRPPHNHGCRRGPASAERTNEQRGSQAAAAPWRGRTHCVRRGSAPGGARGGASHLQPPRFTKVAKPKLAPMGQSPGWSARRSLAPPAAALRQGRQPKVGAGGGGAILLAGFRVPSTPPRRATGSSWPAIVLGRHTEAGHAEGRGSPRQGSRTRVGPGTPRPTQP